MFTGDKSGDFLYQVLFETGFASQPASQDREDGLKLRDLYITSAARCAPPDNRPSKEEFANCRPFLERELRALKNVRVVVALGALALEAFLEVLKSRGEIESRSAFRFVHGAEYTLPAMGLTVLTSYHPSQQNTQTKRLTQTMLRAIFSRARFFAQS